MGHRLLHLTFLGGIRECMGYDRETDFSQYPVRMKTGFLTRNFTETYEPYSVDICDEEYEMGKTIVSLLEDTELYNQFSLACGEEALRFSESIIRKQWLTLLK